MFRPVMPLFEYAVRYDYFAEVLCINKDKPKLQCNGKCELSKRLAEASSPISDKEKTPIPQINLNDYPLTCLYAFNFDVKAPRIVESSTVFYYLKIYINSFTSSIFRPPQV